MSIDNITIFSCGNKKNPDATINPVACRLEHIMTHSLEKKMCIIINYI